ncbi:hypothetical protein AC1031_012957 [Aphanomyces cochlioides]|nr:hypothetical protein AC1031_012957 [Aphanomyces cochlioides]
MGISCCATAGGQARRCDKASLFGKVCRQCQQPRELELSKELVKTQKSLREALAHLQKTQEELQVSRAEGAALKKKVNDLDVTVCELHNQLKREGANAKSTIQMLQHQVEAQVVQVKEAHESVLEQQELRQNVEEALCTAQRQLTQANKSAEDKMHAMRDEIKQLEHQLATKQTQMCLPLDRQGTRRGALSSS